MRLLVLITTTLVALGLVASTASAQTVLRAGIDVDAGTMDPRLAQDTSAARMQELLYSGLVRLDANIVPQPDLALSWEFTSPTNLVFELREGVTFHDGTPFTANDVVYTFTTLVREDFGAPRRSLYTPIADVRALDDHTVEFELSQPYAPILQYLDMGIVPADVAEARGEAFGDEPVGTGPFMLVDWARGDRIRLAANPDYHFGRPNVDEVVISVIPDNNVRLIALEAGDLDIIHSPVPPQDLERLEDDPRLVVHTTTALGYTYLNLNLREPALQDVQVRKALAYLTDRETISEVIFYGMDAPGESFLLPGTFYYTPDVVTYDYDPERAMELLDEAGWVPGPDGVRQRDGERLSFELTTNVDPNRQQILEFLQGEWADAGVEASVRVYEWPSFIGDVIAGDHEIALIGWLLLTDPDRATYLQFPTGGGSNYGAYSNPQVDDLLERGRAETDPEARREIYAEAANIITDEAPYIFLLYQGYVVIHTPSVQDFVVHPAGSWKSFESLTLAD